MSDVSNIRINPNRVHYNCAANSAGRGSMGAGSYGLADEPVAAFAPYVNTSEEDEILDTGRLLAGNRAESIDDQLEDVDLSDDAIARKLARAVVYSVAGINEQNDQSSVCALLATKGTYGSMLPAYVARLQASRNGGAIVGLHPGNITAVAKMIEGDLQFMSDSLKYDH